MAGEGAEDEGVDNAVTERAGEGYGEDAAESEGGVDLPDGESAKARRLR